MKKIIRKQLNDRARDYYLSMKEHELVENKHELQKAKIVVDVLKHFTTVLTALILILSYFGNTFIPIAKSSKIPIMGLSLWDITVFGISLSLCFSLIGLVQISLFPDNKYWNIGIKVLLYIILGIIFLTFSLVIVETTH